jgi:hypothetical protein
MRIPGKIDHDEGLLSLDFIIGFTIFMIALIFVAIMISGLLVHLQSRTIDYDAVAYRTSVVLLEDPGEPNWEPFEPKKINPITNEIVPSWQLLDLNQAQERNELMRLGLAVSKDSPGILQINKVIKFFSPDTSLGCVDDSKLCYPTDYKNYLIFGDYPYNFQIRIKSFDNPPTINYSVGSTPPDQYLNEQQRRAPGYIRRIVKIKYPGTFEINDTGMLNKTSVHLNFFEMFNSSPDTRIDPVNDNLTFKFSNLTAGTQITSFNLTRRGGDPISDSIILSTFPGLTNVTNPDGSIQFNITAGFFNQIPGYNEVSDVYFNINFDRGSVNASRYEYTAPPSFIDAVVEVRIW